VDLPTPEECEQCWNRGTCSRHPRVPKIGRILAICSGLAEDVSDEDRKSYFRLWDFLSGKPGATLTEPPQRPVQVATEPETVPQARNARPMECRNRGEYIRLCGG